MQTRRRQILVDTSAPDTLVTLGQYLPPAKVSVVSTATRTQAPTTPVIGHRFADILKPIQVRKTLPLPVDPVLKSQMARLSSTIPTPLDRLPMIPTEKLKLPPAHQMLPGAPHFVPNTNQDKLLVLASQVKDFLKSKLPNIQLQDILAMLRKAKTPILISLGVAAVAALVFAGYKLYKRFSSSTTPASTPDSTPPTTTHLYTQEDINNITRSIAPHGTNLPQLADQVRHALETSTTPEDLIETLSSLR